MLWSKETFEASLSSRCWQFTPYQEGWDACPDLRNDPVLRQLVELEASLAPVPGWAQAIVERSINYPPFCPHYAFPTPYLEIVAAIGSRTPALFIHGCYTAGPERKERMLDYLFLLDAWLAGAQPEQAAAELTRRGNKGVDWTAVCRDVWQVLGGHTTLKELLIERLLHRQRWWVQSLAWDNDAQDRFLPDHYLGELHGPGDHYGNPGFRDPYFAELDSPRVRQMEARLEESCPDWSWFRSLIHDSWLCGPKAFRFLERTLWSIGKGRRAVSLPSHPLEDGDVVPDFLQVRETYPDAQEARAWVRSFIRALRGWIDMAPPEAGLDEEIYLSLGEPDAVKAWLVGLFLRKLEFLNPYGGVHGISGG